MDYFVEGILDDSLGSGGLECRYNLPGNSFLDDGFNRHPATATQAGNGWITQSGELFQHF